MDMSSTSKKYITWRASETLKTGHGVALYALNNFKFIHGMNMKRKRFTDDEKRDALKRGCKKYCVNVLDLICYFNYIVHVKIVYVRILCRA